MKSRNSKYLDYVSLRRAFHDVGMWFILHLSLQILQNRCVIIRYSKSYA